MGSEIGALTTVRRLRRRGRDAEITVISPTEEHATCLGRLRRSGAKPSYLQDIASFSGVLEKVFKMSMTTDSDHQALDMNIGRIVEMYLMAELELPEVKADLMKLFGGPHPTKISADLNVYLSRMLAQMRQGDLEASEVRLDLVRLADLAQAHDPDFIARIQQDQA